MSETRYIISDAAKMIDVEPHVLRYWEEELGMEIPRNEMGHRYYTDREVRLFTMVRDLKDKGFQLKAIKMVLSALSDENSENGRADRNITDGKLKEERKGIISLADVRKSYDQEPNVSGKKSIPDEKQSIYKDDADEMMRADKSIADPQEGIRQSERPNSEIQESTRKYLPSEERDKAPVPVTAEDKMKHFKYMMDSIMMQALRRNNQTLEADLVNNISDKVIKEMDYLFRMQEEKEEERYRNIDELIRKKQKGRREAAAAKAPLYGPKKSKKRLF